MMNWRWTDDDPQAQDADTSHLNLVHDGSRSTSPDEKGSLESTEVDSRETIQTASASQPLSSLSSPLSVQLFVASSPPPERRALLL